MCMDTIFQFEFYHRDFWQFLQYHLAEGDRSSSEGRVDLLLSNDDIKKTTIKKATIYIEDDDKKDD